MVSIRHVGAHPSEHQHGVSIQISTSLGKTFLRISRIRNILLPWILARVSVYVPPFISHILDLICWTVLIFILIHFEWGDTENQQLFFFLVFIEHSYSVFVCLDNDVRESRNIVIFFNVFYNFLNGFLATFFAFFRAKISDYHYYYYYYY